MDTWTKLEIETGGDETVLEYAALAAGLDISQRPEPLTRSPDIETPPKQEQRRTG